VKALFELQPSIEDVSPRCAWNSVVTQGYCRLAK
jgi:hypothetical protein